MKKNDIAKARRSDIDYEGNLPVLDAFRDHLSWYGLLDKCYIPQKFKMHKRGGNVKGIDSLWNIYRRKKIIITGSAGCGKTTAFKYLYLKGNSDAKLSYYISASSFVEDSSSLDEYEKTLREAVEKNHSLDGIILLDGLEEEFGNNYQAASKLLKMIGQNDNTIWVACRPDFYENLDPTFEGYYADIAEIQPWEREDFIEFLKRYVEATEYKGVKERVDTLIKNSAIEETAVYCPLYATMFIFIASEPDKNGVYSASEGEWDIRDEYDLIGAFITLWIEREVKIQGSSESIEFYVKQFRKIAIDIYKNETISRKNYPSISCDDSVIRGLLKIPRKRKGIARGFYHREFLVYFIVDGMLNAALDNPDEIVYWYSQTFYDDVTNLCKKALTHYDKRELERIYNNFYHIYKASYENKQDIEQAMQRYGLTTEDIDFLKLRDEILYFIFRLPNVDCDGFYDFAYRHCCDTTDYILMLGLAYGMAGIKQHEQTLNFAKKLKNGEPEALVNRSWAVCFFGDVSEDGYTYRDDKNCQWENVKRAKLKRIIKNTDMTYRYRLLDIPLLYCFYESRGFKDCVSYEDYQTILQCDISYSKYTEEERTFITSQKEQLVSEYRKRLIQRALDQNDCKFDSRHIKIVKECGDKTMIEIEKDTAEQILRQGKLSEDVSNSLRRFWDDRGRQIVQEYKDRLSVPAGKPLPENMLNEKLEKCKVLILTANYVEGTIVTQCLLKSSGNKRLERITEDKHTYQFAKIYGIPVVHIWPQGTSSFTVHGSFLALKAAFHRFTPKYVFSVGVAFGADSNTQELGDVLVADHLVFYDSFNKITDGKLTLSPDEVQLIGEEILAGCQFLKRKTPPGEANLAPLSWYLGTMLTGGTVLSDPSEKMRLINAAKDMGHKIIGGEMEGSGIYFACNGTAAQIPFVIVKGICDWAVNKNGWEFVSQSKEDQDEIKDCIQAFSCENAFNVLCYILSQISI